MARKGQFKKGGGRVGGATKTKRRRTASRAMTTTTRHVHHAAPVRRRRRGGRGRSSGGGVRLMPLALAAVGLSYLTGAHGPAFVRTNVAKIPGVKTFGATAVTGVALLAIDRYVKPNKWLKLAGIAGVVLAAVQVGTKGADFKWLGDEGTGDHYDMTGDLHEDVAGDDDDDDDMVEGDDDEDDDEG